MKLNIIDHEFHFEYATYNLAEGGYWGQKMYTAQVLKSNQSRLANAKKDNRKHGSLQTASSQKKENFTFY